MYGLQCLYMKCQRRYNNIIKNFFRFHKWISSSTILHNETKCLNQKLCMCLSQKTVGTELVQKVYKKLTGSYIAAIRELNVLISFRCIVTDLSHLLNASHKSQKKQHFQGVNFPNVHLQKVKQT